MRELRQNAIGHVGLPFILFSLFRNSNNYLDTNMDGWKNEQKEEKDRGPGGTLANDGNDNLRRIQLNLTYGEVGQAGQA